MRQPLNQFCCRVLAVLSQLGLGHPLTMPLASMLASAVPRKVVVLQLFVLKDDGSCIQHCKGHASIAPGHPVALVQLDVYKLCRLWIHGGIR